MALLGLTPGAPQALHFSSTNHTNHTNNHACRSSLVSTGPFVLFVWFVDNFIAASPLARRRR
jgi:hypothetical protein